MSQTKFEQALAFGRPPNIQELFPNSQALIVSGKVIDRACLKKGKCMTIAANGRNIFVIEGALKAAQRANAALILEIARSESTYCPTNMWNLARRVDALCNQYGITIPVAIHADHYVIKKWDDVAVAEREIPTLFDAGITSIAVDASHLPDDQNLLANIKLNPIIPDWAGYETEVGEIKGKHGLSTPVEAKFLIEGLNAHDICPDWIAMNNGTTHGIEDTGGGIQVELTAEIHEAIKPFGTSGAQHGTSGNHTDRLQRVAEETRTTKANVATALQMIGFGVKVNDYGNAIMTDGEFEKVEGRGMSEELWEEITEYAKANNLKGGDYKKLNLPFERRLLGEPREVRERMAKAIEDFIYDLLVNVFNAGDTADLAYDLLIEAGSHDLGPKVGRVTDPAEWTEEKIREKAAAIDTDKGPEGDYDD